ncbi:MAG TPA: PH domain-containing protein [Methanomassiliicoccales archaeon]|jgi:hypothetical protein
MNSKMGSVTTKITSGTPASAYLVSGEDIKWSGKPAAIVILGRGLLLTFFALIYLISMFAYDGDKKNLLPVAVAVIACLLMIWDERRFGLLGGLIGIGIAVVSMISNGGLGYWYLIPLAFALVALLFNYIYLNRVLFLITDRRIITRYGIFSLRFAEVGVDKIQNVTVIQPWYERLLGYGDIYFATSGEKGGIDYESPGIKLRSGGAVSWENVAQPFMVNKIASAVVNPAAMPVMVVNQPAAQPATVSTSDRLKELDELKQKGLVTQQEYDTKRKQILEKL